MTSQRLSTEYRSTALLMHMGEPFRHRPLHLLERKDEEDRSLIILNQPIKSLNILRCIWENTSFRICADGGANRLHDFLEEASPSLKSKYLPDVIVGDLDSLRDDVREFYSSKGVTVSHQGSQDNTDFGKAIVILRRRQPARALSAVSPAFPAFAKHNVLVLGGLGGRVDQGVNLLHALFYHDSGSPELRLWLFSEASITFILLPGRNVIETPRSHSILTPNIGILPLLGPSMITTSGLEWDVQGWLTRIGGQVSSSNHVLADEAIVETTEKVLFTVELADSFTHEEKGP